MLRVILAAWILTTDSLAAQTVEGNVINSATGAGITGATVNLLQAEKTAYSATTDSEGHFRIEAVKVGAYSANYEAPHFWPIPSVFAIPSVFDSVGPPTQFQVTSAADPVRLDAKMAPIGKISGRVTDGDRKPVPKAILSLGWQGRGYGLSWRGETDEKGEYSITDLPGPGEWLISASAPPTWAPPESRDERRLGWAQTFHPGVTDRKLAVKVTVLSGSDLWNVDIKLAAIPVHRVRGRVLDAGGEPVAKARVILGKDIGLPNLRQETKGDGVFEFASVVDDEWRLSAAVDRAGVELWATQEVRMNGEDLDTELRPTPPFPMYGKIVMESRDGVQLAKRPRVYFEGAAIRAAETAAAIGNPDGKGDFTTHLYPAPYYLDSIRLGDRDALEPDVQILSGAEPLTITYKLSGGTVRGTVDGCGAGDVMLIPQDLALRRNRNFHRRTRCAEKGRFEFLAVRPGDYYGVAIPPGRPCRRIS